MLMLLRLNRYLLNYVKQNFIFQPVITIYINTRAFEINYVLNFKQLSF